MFESSEGQWESVYLCSYDQEEKTYRDLIRIWSNKLMMREAKSGQAAMAFSFNPKIVDDNTEYFLFVSMGAESPIKAVAKKRNIELEEYESLSEEYFKNFKGGSGYLKWGGKGYTSLNDSEKSRLGISGGKKHS